MITHHDNGTHLHSGLPVVRVEDDPSLSAMLPHVERAVSRATEWLLGIQQADGHWAGELEGDSILESEYVLLLQFLGDPDRRKMRSLCGYILNRWQNDDGGIPIYPGGQSDVSASVKAYFACKLAGHTQDEPRLEKLRACILTLGGVIRCNTFTKLYLAIFGQYDWEGVPTIPPEFMLAPDWFFYNINEISSWSRAILVPLAIINHHRPYRQISAGCGIDELFIGGRHGRHLRLQWDARFLSWKNAFLALDRLLKAYNGFPIKPFRARAIKAAEQWLLQHQRGSGGLGAIFPAMTHAVMAYKCLGYADSHLAVQHEVAELEKFEISDDDGTRIVPCFSPVWDTAIAINSLLESGIDKSHPAIKQGVEWLLARQTTTEGDWCVRVRGVEPGGWYFQYENDQYPDVDDTVMVLMALYRATCLPGKPWVTAPDRVRSAMQRGIDWVFAMQNRDGGWASFDRNNDKMVLQNIPFADHNAMLDPSTADITARTLEMCGTLGVTDRAEQLAAASQFLLNAQERDGSWFGRWGVNYIYGTWQAVRGLAQYCPELHTNALERAASWLMSVQNVDGGWGETCRSYDDPVNYKALGPSTASQTAWALMALIGAGHAESPAVGDGFEYLLRTQTAAGTWEEASFTGTGFPQVFYLRYHLYRHYFPLWAMAQLLARVGVAAVAVALNAELVD